jgi:hypothetical protein
LSGWYRLTVARIPLSAYAPITASIPPGSGAGVKIASSSTAVTPVRRRSAAPSSTRERQISAGSGSASTGGTS